MTLTSATSPTTITRLLLSRLTRTLFALGVLLTFSMAAHAQVCSTPFAQLISPADGSTLAPDPITGTINFNWCNASADYFVTIETVPGAHDVFFGFTGGTGTAAAQNFLDLGPACAPAPPTGCIPPRGEKVSFTLQTVKNKQIIGSAQYTFTAPTVGSATPDFTVATGAPSVTIGAPGGTGTTTLTITGQANYNGTVRFTAASCAGLPAQSTCSFAPASVTGNGNTTVTVATTAPVASLRHNKQLDWLGVGGAFTFAGVFLVGASRDRRRWTSIIALIAVASFALSLAGCGGSTASNSTTQITSPSTPAGTYTVTITASDSTNTHSTSFSLTIQ